MKKLLNLIVVLMLSIFLAGCYNNIHQKDDNYPYPSKRKPKDVLLDFTYPVERELEFIEKFTVVVENSLTNNFRSGVITNYEDFISYDFGLDLEESFFEDKFIVGRSRLYVKGEKAPEHFHTYYYNDENSKTIVVYTHAQKVGLINTNRDKSNIFLYVFKKSDIDFKGFGVAFNQYEDVYLKPSTYLYVHFKNEENKNFKSLYKSILKEYGLTKYFFVEGVSTNSIKLRISNKEVSLVMVEKELKDFLNDKRVIYYYIRNMYTGYYDSLSGHPDARVDRDGWFGFNVDYDYKKSYQENTLIITSKEEYDNLVENFVYNGEIDGYSVIDLYNPDNLEEFINSLQDKYNEEFFNEYNLIMFGITEGSGSIGNLVTNIIIDENNITVNMIKTIPEVGTDDMAYYTCYIKVPKLERQVLINVTTVGLYPFE